MKLYSKKLYSLDELKKERQKLCRIKNENAPDTWFSLKEDHKGPQGEEDGESLLSGLLSGLSGSPLVSTALSLAPSLLGMIGGKKINHLFKKAGKDVVSSYVKWKGVQLALRGVNAFIRSKKKEKSDDKK